MKLQFLCNTRTANIIRSVCHSKRRNYIFFTGLLITSPAYAYIDPGSTLLLIQGILALIGGIIVFIKHPIETIKSLYSKFRKKKDNA